MDLQSRKLNIIQYLIGLQDEKTLGRIEATIEQGVKNADKVEPFTQDEMILRAKQANKDYSEGNFITQEKLATDSEKW